KIFMDFAKENDKLVVKGGILSGQMLDANAIKALGEIPPREVLLSRVVAVSSLPYQVWLALCRAPCASLFIRLTQFVNRKKVPDRNKYKKQNNLY
ncbi:MAG: hypothetical protein U1E11_05860, partial [Dethiobacteria bacterium]|nr:hypothetical protein [Dethiobacteria bacterium]